MGPGSFLCCPRFRRTLTCGKGARYTPPRLKLPGETAAARGFDGSIKSGAGFVAFHVTLCKVFSDDLTNKKKKEDELQLGILAVLAER